MKRINTIRSLAIAVLVFCLLACHPAVAQVNYTLEGVISLWEDQGKLTTVDGRVFRITGISSRDLAKFENQNVVIEGSIRQADILNTLKVKKIQKKPIDAAQVVLPPLKQRQRPAKMVSYSNGVMTIDNIRWGQKPGQSNLADPGLAEHLFRTIRLKPELVDNVYFCLKPFKPKFIAAHALMIFTFKPDAIITTKNEQTQGLILTIEAWQRVNQKFSLTDGLKNMFGSSWILTSYEDYMEEIKVRKEEIILYPAILTHDQKKKLVEECVKYASVNREGEYYNTVTNNCTNNLVVMLNRVLEAKRKVNMWWLPNMVYNLKATVPVAVPKMLIKKGILKNEMKKFDYKTSHLSIQEQGL
ncbi:MAG: hypothetical protein CVV42_04775 [Candidatus Riflebacteria bacterium HGW-Riflebacteria-2]|jgi:hypothetical protein|nr:MAG: hypothetical protein CVV42_04775 [Candidatus Riflebacteria bacterium HGW-Riflebacteria-2]